MRLLLALCMLVGPVSLQDNNRPPNADPTIDLSAVRYISCDDWTGSGFLVGDKMLMTANHVLDGGSHCIDVASGSPLKIYKQDKAHDLALATGPKLPTDIPYFHVSCQPFKKNQKYFAYGITDYMQNEPILRENTLTASGKMEPQVVYDDDVIVHTGPMEEFGQPVAPGMSGGPVVDDQGLVHAVVNAGTVTSTILFQLSDGMVCKP